VRDTGWVDEKISVEQAAMSPFENVEIPCPAMDWEYLFPDLFLKLSEKQNFAFPIIWLYNGHERSANRGYAIIWTL
jgi:hypothetical protein